ncbi:hypothetical protein Cci01nite_33430 [Catellatospora citrea]|uniref:Uncharacterized protein n=1 Tax=Catellatospora citrea TaxID=53366 RepID=A0A8J3KCS3_9ACTN|nr:hypothetical protein Cci01nite_33430 [Catellatospora citrea]
MVFAASAPGQVGPPTGTQNGLNASGRARVRRRPARRKFRAHRTSVDGFRVRCLPGSDDPTPTIGFPEEKTRHPASSHEEVNHDPDRRPPPGRLRTAHARIAGPAALHDRRTGDRRKLGAGMRIRIIVALASLATLLYAVGAPYEHGG